MAIFRDEIRGAPAGSNGLSITGDGGEKTGRMTFAASLSDLNRAKARSEAMKLGGYSYGDSSGSLLNARTDIWAEGVVAHQQNSELGSEGHFGMMSASIDYLVRPGFLAGVMAQYDRMDEQFDVLGFEISGHGWMAGPYLGFRLSDNLFLDARALWGTSENQIARVLTYTDNFESERFLASARLTGHWNHGPWTFSPSAEFVWFEDESEAYTDSNGLAIAGQNVELGRIIFGPEVSYSFTGTGGALVVPRLALKGLWNFETPEAVTISGITISQDGFTARLEAGVGIIAHWGARLDLGAAYDGIGSDASEAVSGKAALTFPLN